MNTSKEELENIRVSYHKYDLSVSKAAPDPVDQFDVWFDQWLHSEPSIGEINAATLATVNKHGQPSVRIILLKSFDKDGFVFYTNYNSRKAREIASNNKVGLNFFWPKQERQVRIEGWAEKVSAEVSDEYFHTRPRGSQLGAIASDQSTIVPDREFLEKKFATLEEKMKNKPVKRPENWGGYIIHPTLFEFWQGRENRLHDRVEYRLDNNRWEMNRLAP